MSSKLEDFRKRVDWAGLAFGTDIGGGDTWREVIESAAMQARVSVGSVGSAQASPCETRAWWEHIRVNGAMQQRALEAEMQRADEPPRMSDPPQSEPTPDTSAGAVQQRIDQVCNDLVAGSTTPAQQRALGSAVERAGRIPAGSDAAVGRIARLPR